MLFSHKNIKNTDVIAPISVVGNIDIVSKNQYRQKNSRSVIYNEYQSISGKGGPDLLPFLLVNPTLVTAICVRYTLFEWTARLFSRTRSLNEYGQVHGNVFACKDVCGQMEKYSYRDPYGY